MIVIQTRTPTFYDYGLHEQRLLPCRRLAFPGHHRQLQRSSFAKPSKAASRCGGCKDATTKANAKPEEKEQIPITGIRNVSIHDEENHQVISMDLPGVRADAIKVMVHDFVLSIDATRKNSDGTAVVKYQQKFLMDKKSVNHGLDITANLSDGVLVVKIPKKEEASLDTREIILSEDPMKPNDHDSSSLVPIVQMEIPGVKSQDLKITVTGQRLSISAVRKRESPRASLNKIERRYDIDEEKVDLSNATAYLSHGILTIVAPTKKKDTTSLASRRRDIPVTLALSRNEEASDSNETGGKPVVETVAEVEKDDKEEEEKDRVLIPQSDVTTKEVDNDNNSEKDAQMASFEVGSTEEDFEHIAVIPSAATTTTENDCDSAAVKPDDTYDDKASWGDFHFLDKGSFLA